jgi:hypothetical protein
MTWIEEVPAAAFAWAVPKLGNAAGWCSTVIHSSRVRMAALAFFNFLDPEIYELLKMETIPRFLP